MKVGPDEGRRNRDAENRQQGNVTAGAVFLAVDAGFFGESRHPRGFEQGKHNDYEHEQAYEHQAGKHCPDVDVADGNPQLIGKDDQYQGGGNDLGQGPRRRYDSGGDAVVVAVAEHDGERNQPHRNNRRRHDPGSGGQQGADEDGRKRETAPQGAEQLADGLQQVLGHAAPFEDQAHKGEEGNCQHGFILDNSHDPERQRLEEGILKEAEFHADESEGETGGREAEGDGEAGKQKEKETGEHKGYEVVSNEFHVSIPPDGFCQSFLQRLCHRLFYGQEDRGSFPPGTQSVLPVRKNPAGEGEKNRPAAADRPASG